MALPLFRVTWDYRCPFARNAHEHLIDGLEAGAPWTVDFVPFSLNQAHVPEGGVPVWEDDEARPDLMALEAGVVVRDRRPDDFLRAHRALFSARHDQGGDLRDRGVVQAALEAAGVPADEVFSEIEQGWPRLQVQKEHEEVVRDLAVFGVPTFIVDDQAVFVRLTDRPQGDGPRARSTIEHVVQLLVEHPTLNEFKHTRISR